MPSPDQFSARGARVGALVLCDQLVQLGHDVLEPRVDVASERRQLHPVQLAVQVGVDLVHRARPVHLLR